ncbi:MAG: J domain-containing protein [bacterium]|nr:J domain-containing protein [bacterium]
MAKDYYKVLGIDKKADKGEVRKAFHKLAHQYHPDKKGGDASKFKELSEAYSVLSDDKKRAEYDTYGQTFNGNGPGGFSAEGGPAGWDFSNFTNQGDFQDFDFGNLGDIFGDIFTGGTRERTPRGRDISIDLEISFEESIFGVSRKVLLTKQSLCNTCNGNGGRPGTDLKTCNACNGNGKIHEAKRSFFGTVSVTRTCPTCKGTGKIPKEHCSTCRGVGVTRKQEEILVVTPPGIENGEVIRMTSQGEAIAGGIAGDLYVKIYVKKHSTIYREGSNLITNFSIKLTDALLGAEYKITTLDGPVTISIPQGITFGEILRVRGRGVPVGKNRRGDFLIKISIVLPQKFSKNAKQLIDELKKEGM